MTSYGTSNPVLIEARVNHDPYDEYAWCQEWRFAIANYLWWDRGERVSNFNPSMFGPDESYAYSELKATDPSLESLHYAFTILTRYREWLRLAGRDY